jgi:hypothetical protein
MTIQDHLKRLLDETPDINLVAFGDLSSGLILNWAATTARPREALDLLGEQAVKCLALVGGEPLAPGPDRDRDGTGRAVIRFTEHETQIFTRLTPGSEDVLCAVCEPGAELEPLLEASETLARQIGGAS